MDYRLPDSFIHGILQARILEWVAFPSPGDLSDPGIEARSPALQADSLPTEPPGSIRFLTVKQCYILVIPLSQRTQNKIQSSTNAYKVTCTPCDPRSTVPWPWLGWEVEEIAASL